MSDDEDDVEWEYEDESDVDDGDAAPQQTAQDITDADAAFHYSAGEEDDAGDIDWEDAAQPMDEPSASPMQEDDHDYDATETMVDDLNTVNWDHINSVLQREADKERGIDTPKTKRTVVRMTKQDKAHELALHKSHLLVLLGSQLRLNALCQSRVLRGLLLSLTSDASFDFFTDMDTEPLAYTLELLVQWFHGRFRLTDQDEDGDVKLLSHSPQQLTENKLLRTVFDRSGHYAELALLFTALCRALGLSTRLVVAMDPLVVQQHSKSAESAATASPSLAKTRRKRSRNKDDEDSVAHRTPHSTSPRVMWAWSEVLIPKTKNWIVVDAVRKAINSPRGIGALRGKYLPLSYVVSVEEDGYLTDVTPRYVERWSTTMQRRLAHDWLLRSLQLMNSQVDTISDDSDVRTLRELERAKLRQLTESEEMPTSFEAFKKHHLYCLERHLGRFECVYPRKAVGLFKGHAVFLRKSIQTTRSWHQWRRLGREVREEERDRPAQRLGKVSKTAADDDSDGAASGGQSTDTGSGRALYGYWQTDEIVPPRVDGVTVPKNKFGNIELWSPAHLPLGAVHLQLPRISKVAEQLGVDFAPAVVGFEARNGVNYPQFDGIVVAEAVAETLLDAHAHVQQTMIEKAINKNQQLIVKRWERLMKRLMLKQRLNEEYGEI